MQKKNSLEAFESRLASLELAVDGRLTNINPNHFLGREINQGVVTQIPFSRFATQATIDQAIMDMIGGAPDALNTIRELARAMNDDANFATNIINQLALKAPLNNPIFSGAVTLGGNYGSTFQRFIGLTDASIGNTNFLHNLSFSKICSIKALINGFPPGYNPSAFGGSANYNVFVAGSYVYIVCDSNFRSSLLNKQYNILIEYIP